MRIKSPHTEVEERIKALRDTVTDDELFCSDAFSQHLQLILNANVPDRNTRCQLDIYSDDSPTAAVAWTDGTDITINCKNALTEGHQTRKLKYFSLLGLMAHELGHIIYTDFEASKVAHNAIALQRWYPCAPSGDAKTIEEIAQLTAKYPLFWQIIEQFVHSITNTLEDAYIEMRICAKFPGTFARGIAAINDQLYEQTVPLDEDEATIKANDKEAAITRFGIAMNSILCYAKFGDIKLTDIHYTSELLTTVYSALPIIDDAIVSNKTEDRFAASAQIIVILWKYLKEHIENELEDAKKKKKKGSDAQNAAKSSQTGRNAPQSASGAGGDQSPSGSQGGSQGNSDGISDKNQEQIANAIKKTIKSIAQRVQTDTNTSTAQASAQSQAKQQEPISQKDAQKARKRSSSAAASKTNSASGAGGTGASTGAAEAAMDENITDLITKVARTKATKELEEKAVMAMASEAKELDVPVTIYRDTTVSPHYRQMYEMKFADVQAISKRLQRGIKQLLKDKRQGGVINGLPMGKRLHARDVIRGDGKIFYKTTLPQEDAELAVAVLIDESGSMNGNRRVAAMLTAVLLEDFLRGLNLPRFICGHASFNSQCDINVYCAFNNYDGGDKYRLMGIKSNGGTPTAPALEYVYNIMQKRTESNRLIIVITDGQPAGGAEGINKIANAVKQNSKKGINTIGIAIGRDLNELRRCYGDNLLDMTDLSMLPTSMVSLVKKNIRLVG